MRNVLLPFLLLLTLSLTAQNPADIDLVVGSGYVDFHKVDVIATQSDGKVLVGGSFHEQLSGQHWVGNLVRFNTDGSIDDSFQAEPFYTSGYMTALAIQPDGKILVGGNFSLMGDEPAMRFVRLNADGSIDTAFVHEVYGIVRSIALQPDGKIVVGGNFSGYVNGHVQRYVLRLNPDGSKDHSFDFGFEGFAALYTQVKAVTVQADGKILAGGNFMTFNNEPQGMLIRFNADGTKDTSFDIGVGGAPNTIVEKIIEQPDGKLLITAARNWNGTSYPGLIRLNSDGSMDTSFNLGDEVGTVTTAALKPDGKIIIIGQNSIDEEQIAVVRLNSNGSVDHTFTHVPSESQISCVELQADGKILIGGYLKDYAGVMKNAFTRLNSDGTPDTSFNIGTGLNDQVFSIAPLENGKTLIGGSFTRFQGESQNGIVRLNYTGGKDASFNIGTGFNNTVKKITVQPDGKILVGGDFTEFNGAPANRIVRLNSDGSKDNTFNAGSGFDHYVQTIAVQPDGKVLVGGRFTSFNGLPQMYCVRLNADGSKDSSFEVDEAFGDRVTQIAMHGDDKIFAAGNFVTFNGENQRFMVMLNPDGSKDPGFDVGTSLGSYVTPDHARDIVDDIAIQEDGKIVIIAGTYFYQDQSLGQPLRIHADGSIDEDFEHSISFSHGQVRSVAIQTDGKILLGGSYYTANTGSGGQAENRMTRLHANGGKDTLFNINEGHEPQSGGFYQGSVNTIVIDPGNKIWVGGNFFHYRLTSSFAAIRLVGEGSPVSVDNVAVDETGIVVYPNPVKDVLYINERVKMLKVTQIDGKVVMVKEHTDFVDMSSYPSGLYLITLEREDGHFETVKVVKE